MLKDYASKTLLVTIHKFRYNAKVKCFRSMKDITPLSCLSMVISPPSGLTLVVLFPFGVAVVVASTFDTSRDVPLIRGSSYHWLGTSVVVPYGLSFIPPYYYFASISFVLPILRWSMVRFHHALHLILSLILLNVVFHVFWFPVSKLPGAGLHLLFGPKIFLDASLCLFIDPCFKLYYVFVDKP